MLGRLTADIGGAFSLPRSAIRVALRHPRIARAEMRGTAGHGFVGELFGRANLALTGPLQELAERERPDLIVFESLSEAGAVVAGRLSIPSVLQENTLWPAAELFRAVTKSAALAGPGIPNPELTIGVIPPSLRAAAPGSLMMRPVPYSGGGAVPDWLRTPGDRPRVLVSRSTLDGPNDGDPGPAVIAAASAVDAEFVLVRPARPGTLPRNVKAVGREVAAGQQGVLAGVRAGNGQRDHREDVAVERLGQEHDEDGRRSISMWLRAVGADPAGR